MIATLLLQTALVFGTCADVPVDDPNAYAPAYCETTWELEAYASGVCASLPNMDSDWWQKPETCDEYDHPFTLPGKVVR